MNVAWGIVLLALGLLAWIGQILSLVAPKLAVRWGLTEDPAVTDPVVHADVRGEAAWDTVTLWTLPAAGLLLLLDVTAWAYLGLVGGGVYAYFGGRGIFARAAMRRRGIPIGDPTAVPLVLTFLTLWALAGIATIGLSIGDLPTP